MRGDLKGEGLYHLKREAGRHWLSLILVLILAYFAYHSIHGARGLFAYLDRSHELELERLELARVQAERQWLEARVAALDDSDGIALDLLEETLYDAGFVYPNEVVILAPEPAAGGEAERPGAEKAQSPAGN